MARHSGSIFIWTFDLTKRVKMLIESLSGVRGFDTDLTEDLITGYAWALHELCNCRSVVIGRDSRTSGEKIKDHFVTAMTDVGVTVVDLGLSTTPTVQHAVGHHRADAGVVITASHNPLPWNGIKLLGRDGMFVSPAEMRWLQERRHVVLGAPYASRIEKGRRIHYSQADADHIELVLKIPYLDRNLIQRRNFKVVTDTVNGAASRIIPQLLTQLGCRVVALNDDPLLPFPHTPEPLPENLKQLCAAVKAEGADLGLAIDPDGDRLAIIADDGLPISEEYTLVLAEKLVLSKSTAERRIVVTNLSTTLAVDDVARQFDAQVIRTPIGEINVARRMQEVGAVIGGEGNGGVILPEAHLGRDSLVGTALILQLLSVENCPLSALMKRLPHYIMVKQKAPRGELRLETLIERLKALAPDAMIDTEDGIKFTWPDRWVHVRSSNTEPIVRVYAEAPTEKDAQTLADCYIRFFQNLT